MNQQGLAPVNLQLFAFTIHASGSPLDNYRGFIDGTVRPICRPRKDQHILYNGHKKVHAIKFQSVDYMAQQRVDAMTEVCLVGDSGLFRDL